MCMCFIVILLYISYYVLYLNFILRGYISYSNVGKYMHLTYKIHIHGGNINSKFNPGSVCRGSGMRS